SSTILDELNEPYEILAAQANIALEWAVPPGIRVVSDGDLLRQILHNLLGNACRYAASTARLRVSLDGQETVLSLDNDYRSETRAPGGLGIGLRLVRALTNSMEGHQFSIRDNGRVFAVLLVWKRSTQ
ncbi:MAG: ATP-binding protein, partial [Verrucomicrobiota bacterium]